MTAIIAIALGMVSLVPLTAAVVAAQDAPTNHGDGTVEEQQFVAKINDLRASKGLPTLAIDGELTTQARIWSTTMKNAGNIFHSQDLSAGITADWQKLGENVGVGGTVGALFDAFVASPKHYENLVDPMYRSIGIGVVWDGDRMFTAHRFMGLFPSSPAPKPATPTPPKKQAPASKAPSTTSPPATDPPTTEVPQELAATTPGASLPAAAAPPPVDPVRVGLELNALRAFLS